MCWHPELPIWFGGSWRTASLSLLAATRGRNLAGAHEVADILLQELIIVVEFVVLLAYGLDTVENREQRVLQRLGVSRMVSAMPS